MTASLSVALLPDQRTALVTGRHRTRFLHAMTTAHVNALKPGETTLGLMATANGRHVGQFRLECDENSLTLVAAAASLEAVLAALTKHRVADDVRWKQAGEEGGPAATTTVALYGDGAVEAVSKLIGQALSLEVAHTLAIAESAFGPLHLSAYEAAQSELQRPTLLVRLAPEQAQAFYEAMVREGAQAMDGAAWEEARILAQWPQDGADLQPEDVALAAERLHVAVSWNKGCFLGQEVYVMARDRGELPKKLRLVSLSAPDAVQVGDALVADGKAVGKVGSAVTKGEQTFALAMLKRKHTQVDTVVNTEAGVSGRVLGH